MKKILLSLAVIAASINLMAVDYTSKATITLKGTTSNEVCEMTVGQTADPLAPYYCAEMNMTYRRVAFYAINSATNYQIYVAADLASLPFGLKTYTDLNYSLTISNVEGTETLKMKDEVTGTVFDLTEGYVYNFTADANQAAITDRFHLYVAPSVPGICHRYGKLQVTGMKDTNVVVKNMDDSATSIGTVAITANYQEIDLAGLAAGQYKVEYNDGTAHTVIIDVQ